MFFNKCEDTPFIIQLIKSLSRQQNQTLRKVAPKVGNKKDVWDHVIPVKFIVDEIIKMILDKDVSQIEKLLTHYTNAGQRGLSDEEDKLLKTKYNCSMPQNWCWKNKNVNLFARYHAVGIIRFGNVENMNLLKFLDRIYNSIKVGDLIQKPRKVSEILNITDGGHIYYRIGEKNKKAVTKQELSQTFKILQNRDLTNVDIRKITTKAKPCNVTSIKWLLTNSGLVVEKSTGVFSKTW